MGTSSINALLKHFKRYFLVWSSFMSAFMTSAGMLSTPDALLFFMLFIVLTNSSSRMMGFSIISDPVSVISSIIFCLCPCSLSYQKEKFAFSSFWYTWSVHLDINSLLHDPISIFSPFSVKMKASSESSLSLPRSSFIIFQKAFLSPQVFAILFSSHWLFFCPVILAVLLFCRIYSCLYLSMTSSGSFLFLACLQALLSCDLSLIFPKSSVSTQVAAFMIVCFFPPGFFLSFLLMAYSTEDLILLIHFLKESFFPILFLKSSTHRFILSCSLLIQVISFTGFLSCLGKFSFPIRNQALTRL